MSKVFCESMTSFFIATFRFCAFLRRVEMWQMRTSHFFENLILSVFCGTVQNASLSFPPWKKWLPLLTLGTYCWGVKQSQWVDWCPESRLGLLWEDVQLDEAEASREPNHWQHCVNWRFFLPALIPKRDLGVQLFLTCESASRRNGLRIHFVYLVRRK